MFRKQTVCLLLAVMVMMSLQACSPPQTDEESPLPTAPREESPAPQPSLPEKGALQEFVTPGSAPQSASLSPSLELMMETIDALCGSPRPMGSREEYEAALFLQGRLEEWGYLGELEGFSYDTTGSTRSERYRQARALTGNAFLTAALPGEEPNGNSQNVIGRQLGEEEREQILVLSAHYDSTPDSIGVVDNSSGVAVVLEAARLLSGEELPFGLRIVFFGGEEEILIGSRQHVVRLSPEEVRRIVGNISVDTLAYSPRQEFAALTPLLLPQEDKATLAASSPVAAALLADSRVAPTFYSQLVGDHMAFSAAGIDSVNFGQSMDAVSGIINTPADTYELLAPELLPTAVELLVEAVRELGKQLPSPE